MASGTLCAMSQYEIVEAAISYIAENFRTQPDLSEVAAHVRLSPFHLVRVFKKWAGVTPKKFLQYVSLGYAKSLLREKRPLLDVSYETGFSGTGRLHDLFVTIEAMTPGEYKNRGEGLRIKYDFPETPFGQAIVASTGKGICFLSFIKSREEGVRELTAEYPQATLVHASDTKQKDALRSFGKGRRQPVRLHIKGTSFQLKVWAALLRIPEGTAATYSEVARAIGHPGADRAVGSAVSKNPVVFIIPCHRVIRATGLFGEYGGGRMRKRAMLGWEAIRTGKYVSAAFPSAIR